MSYSFSVRAATKAEAKSKVAEELAKVVQAQPIHAADQAQAQAAADAFIDLISDDETKDLQVSVYGSVAWNPTEAEPNLTSAGIGVNACLCAKETTTEGTVVDAEFNPASSEPTT